MGHEHGDGQRTAPPLDLGRAVLQSPLPMFTFDGAMRIVDCNDALAELFRIPRTSLIGFDLSGISSSGPHQALQRALTGERVTWKGRYLSPLAGREIVGVLQVGPVRVGEEVVGGIGSLSRADVENTADADPQTRLALSWYGTVDALWEYDVGAGALALSSRLRELLGYSYDELPDNSDAFTRIVHEEDRPFLAELFRSQDGARKPIDVDLRMRDRAGGSRLFRLRGRELRDAAGQPTKLVGSLSDLTSTHRARAAAREAEAMFRAVAQQSATGIAILGEGGRFAFANQRLAEIFGYALDELLVLDVSAIVHPDDRAMVAENIRRRISAAVPAADYRTRGLRKDGSVIVLEVHGNAVDVEGQRMAVATLLDVTSRVESDQRIADALAAADLDRRQLRATLDALPVGVWISDAAGVVVATNAAALRLWSGDSSREHRGDPDDYVAWWSNTSIRITKEDWPLKRALRDGSPVEPERIDIERFDGTRGCVLNSAAPIKDAEGRITGAVMVMLDMSDQREVEREREALIASLEFERRRLESIFAAAPTFLASMRGPNHVVELANRAFYDVVGHRDIVGKPVGEALPEVQSQGIIALLDRVYRTGEPFVGTHVPVQFQRSESGPAETRFTNFSYLPIEDETGTRVGTIVNGYDVTELVQAEQARRTGELRMRAQFQALPIPTFVFQLVERDGERDFILVDHNDAADAMTENKLGSVLGRRPAEYLSNITLVDHLWRALEGGPPPKHEVDYTFRTTGQTRRLALTFCAAPPDIVIVHCEDISDRIALEEQLRQSQKMEAVGQLAGGVAHDFNNVLAVITTCAEFVAEGLEPTDPKYADIEEIRRAADRAADLTKKLLTFSRRQRLQVRSVDFDAIVTGTETMLRRIVGSRIALTLRTGTERATVRADAGQLEQVVVNFVVNARDAMPNGGALSIETKLTEVDAATGASLDVKPGSYVALTVTDTGNGIPPEILARVFEPFFTTKELGRGTGLGLSTVYAIARQHRGYVAIDTAVGRGTTFEFALPREATVVPTTLIPQARERGRVLIVDDEPGVLALARRVLERAGYEVLAVGSGAEALAKVTDETELVLTDFVMPDINGRQLRHELSLRFPKLPVLYMSGYVDDATVRQDGDVALLAKPFTAASLVAAVRAAMAK